ncbi:MAG: AAA family ATPase [Candidatus Micrarchaeia archaeon]
MAQNVIIITGTPGTGKTSLARALAKRLGALFVSINGLVEEKKLWAKIEGGCKVVRMAKLEEELRRMIKECRKLGKRIVIEGHLGCELHVDADIVLVLRTHPEILRRRYARRKYRIEKIEENVMAEMLDYCVIMSEKNYRKAKIIEIDTSKTKLKDTLKKTLAFMEKGKGENVDWSGVLFESV